eukprot:FR743597.1.p1 GENE.FR743597.1~~FR743597.1.p1  ORF type:complete len:214 (+),score=11.60 FR743597.1:89-643(+)
MLIISSHKKIGSTLGISEKNTEAIVDPHKNPMTKDTAPHFLRTRGFQQTLEPAMDKQKRAVHRLQSSQTARQHQDRMLENFAKAHGRDPGTERETSKRAGRLAGNWASGGNFTDFEVGGTRNLTPADQNRSAKPRANPITKSKNAAQWRSALSHYSSTASGDGSELFKNWKNTHRSGWGSTQRG